MAFRATSALRQGLRALRPAAELAQRTSCLQLVLARWGLETAALMGLRGEATAGDGDDRKVRAVEAITAAMYSSSLDRHATETEKTMLEKPYGSWQYDDYVYGDHWEALGVLQWILGQQPTIPPYFSNFDRAQLFQNTGIMPADPATIEGFVDRFQAASSRDLRSEDELQRAVDSADAWIWRARAQVLLALRGEIDAARTKKQSESETPLEEALRTRHIPHGLRRMAGDMPRMVPLAAKHAYEKDLIDRVEGDDFGIEVEMKEADGKVPAAADQKRTATVPYAKLDVAHQDALRKIAESRFLALGWSLGKIGTWNAEETGELSSLNPVNALWMSDEK